MGGAIIGGGLIAGAAAGLAAAAAQIWGAINSRPATSVPEPTPGDLKIKGTVPPLGSSVGATLRYRRGPGTAVFCNKSDCSLTGNESVANPVWFTAGNVFGVADIVAEKVSGRVRTVRLALEQADGSLANSELLYGQSFGYVDLSPGIETEWQGPGAVQWRPDMLPVPLPDGWEPEMQPETVPVLPPLITPVLPPPTLPQVPDADPVGVPTPPGPTRPAVPAVPAAPVFVPIRLPGSAPVDNGVVVPPKPAPIPTTPSDVVFPVPGGAPVGGPGQSPRPDAVGIAQEVGRIERKLEGLLNPKDPEVNPVPEWLGDLGKIADLLSGLLGGGSYTLTEPCDPDGDGKFVRREIKYSGAAGMLGLLSNKIDALAQLQQAAKDLRQPTCPRPRPQGELVTARFRSTTPSPNSLRVLRKELRYRDNAGRPEADHVAHWLGFEWQAGPAIVHSKGASWGIVEVWAADPEEGRRVIRHAAAIAGVDLTAPGHAWVDATPRSTRYGQPGLMRVEHTQDGIPCISKRDGPSGTPSWMRDP